MYIYTQLIYLIYVSITVGLINAFAPDQFLPARCYASAGNSDRNVSVRPSVCHAPVLCQNEES